MNAARPHPLDAADQIEDLVMPGFANALGVVLPEPRTPRSPPPNTTVEAIARVCRDLSLSAQRRVLAVADEIADLEEQHRPIYRVNIVSGVSVNEART